MKWLLVVGGMLVAIILIVVIVGALLPRDHVASVSARVAGTREAIWTAITDVANQPTWRDGVKRVELAAPIDGKAAWVEHSSNGSILMVADHSEPPRRFVTRIADTKLPFGGSWEFVLEPAGADAGANAGADASTVTITERGSVYNPIFRFMSRFVFGHTATMDAYLRSLGRKFGRATTPTVVATTKSP